jgi:hypothetical protein
MLADIGERESHTHTDSEESSLVLGLTGRQFGLTIGAVVIVIAAAGALGFILRLRSEKSVYSPAEKEAASSSDIVGL